MAQNISLNFIEYLESYSQSLYSQAEELLLEELGLKDWQPSTENINEKSFSESFLSTGRLDAEYYQPKYEELEEKIKEYKDGYCLLGDLIDSYSTGYPFKSENYQDQGTSLIRINNIGKGVLNLDNSVKISNKDLQLSTQ